MTLRVHCTDLCAIAFMFNAGSSYIPQLFIQLTPKAAWYRPCILGQGSECKNNETLLSGTLALSIQYILDVAQASCECKSATTINHVIGYEDIHEKK